TMAHREAWPQAPCSGQAPISCDGSGSLNTFTKCPGNRVRFTGYFSAKNVALAEARGANPHIATGRERRGGPRPPPRGRPRIDLTPKERMARKLSTKRGDAVYRQRKTI